jgi:dolichyl-phosphate-mannose-protein mannosyltransferase
MEHHYLPALYFAIMVLCQELDFLTNRIKSLGLASRPAKTLVPTS